MNCPSCDSDNCLVELRTGADGGPAGLHNKCCQCGNSWQPEAAGKVMPRIVQGLPTKTVNAPTQSPTSPHKRITPRSVVAEAKQELRRLDKEIARLEKLKRQRAELARLLDAASGKPSAVVELKRASNTR